MLDLSPSALSLVLGARRSSSRSRRVPRHRAACRDPAAAYPTLADLSLCSAREPGIAVRTLIAGRSSRTYRQGDFLGIVREAGYTPSRSLPSCPLNGSQVASTVGREVLTLSHRLA